MSRGAKIGNEYAARLAHRYGETPKSVMAAVMVSLLIKQSGTDDFSGILDAVRAL